MVEGNGKKSRKTREEEAMLIAKDGAKFGWVWIAMETESVENSRKRSRGGVADWEERARGETEGVTLLGCHSGLHSLAELCFWSPLSPTARFSGRKTERRHRNTHADMHVQTYRTHSHTYSHLHTHRTCKHIQMNQASDHPHWSLLKSSANYISSGNLCKMLPLRMTIHNAWSLVFGSWWHVLTSSTSSLYLGRPGKKEEELYPVNLDGRRAKVRAFLIRTC